jgi:hypothetical protein
MTLRIKIDPLPPRSERPDPNAIKKIFGGCLEAGTVGCSTGTQCCSGACIQGTTTDYPRVTYWYCKHPTIGGF